MTEQGPQPVTPPEAPIPVPHREKTEAEVAGQINRIANKILDRAVELPGELRNDGSTPSLEDGHSLRKFSVDDNRFLSAKDARGNRVSLQASYSQAPDEVRLSKTSEDFNLGFVEGNDKNHGIHIDARTDGSISATHQLERRDKAGREHTPLTLNQTISASGNILRKVRGEVARREIIAEKKKQEDIEGFIKS